MKLSYKYHTFNVPLWFLRLLKRRMRWIRAAGGIVSAPDGTILLITRNGRADLPKGKVEPGETLIQAALREVEEETGIKVESGKWKMGNVPDAAANLSNFNFQLSTPIKTYHIFNLYGGWHLKQTSWFPMTAERQSIVPQLEEGITAGEWVSPSQWHHRLQHSYGTLRTLSKTISHYPATNGNP